MKRRGFLGLFGGALAVPLVSPAESPAAPVETTQTFHVNGALSPQQLRELTDAVSRGLLSGMQMARQWPIE
jgi:hypothetical protein